jgi:hypothetical protein
VRVLRRTYLTYYEHPSVTHIAVSTGVPDEPAAHDLSRALVEERLAAGTRAPA